MGQKNHKELKTPRIFKTSDKAHTGLLNDMMKVINENDSTIHVAKAEMEPISGI